MHIKFKNGLHLNISESNRKLGDISSFSVSPVVTCPKDAPCFKDCYACHMCRKDSIAKSYRNNLNAFTLTDKSEIIRKISNYININELEYFRWNVSGDFRLDGYFEVACKVAEKCPNCHFLAFTKCFELATCDRPKNFTLVLSAWNDYTPTEKQAKQCGIAYYDDGSRLMPEHARVCSGRCDKCFKCFKLKPGQAVIFKKH
jgi:hypothetical protein